MNQDMVRDIMSLLATERITIGIIWGTVGFIIGIMTAWLIVEIHKDLANRALKHNGGGDDAHFTATPSVSRARASATDEYDNRPGPGPSAKGPGPSSRSQGPNSSHGPGTASG